MMMVGPLILLLLAQATLSLADSRKYQFVNLLKTWSEAQAYCREHFTDLATMDTTEDWAEVRQLVLGSGHTYIWMGLYDDVDGWRWSVDDAPLNDAEIASLPQTFNGHKGEKHCVLWWNGGLHDYDCDSAFYLVCYDEPSDTYVPVTVLMTWESAQQHCRGAYTDLTSVRTPQEQERVSIVVDTYSHWWIGLSRGPRKWSDGSTSLLRPWEPGQPIGFNHDCGCVAAPGWHDCDCSWILTFICWTQTATVFKVGLKTDGSADLNDTQTQESVLMQIGKQMRDQGFRQDFRLRWMKQSDGEIICKNTTQL